MIGLICRREKEEKGKEKKKEKKNTHTCHEVSVVRESEQELWPPALMTINATPAIWTIDGLMVCPLAVPVLT